MLGGRWFTVQVVVNLRYSLYGSEGGHSVGGDVMRLRSGWKGSGCDLFVALTHAYLFP